MKIDRPQSTQFEAFAMQCLQDGLSVRFQARGASMSPAIRDGETVYIRPVSECDLRCGDIILVKNEHGFCLHRLVAMSVSSDVFTTRGDCGMEDDPTIHREQILGVAVAKDVRLGVRTARASFRGISGTFVRSAARVQFILTKGLIGPVNSVGATVAAILRVRNRFLKKNPVRV